MIRAPEALRAPYKLFDYYTFADRDLFFGREEEVLQTVGEVLTTRLLVLFAPSGSGKSSLINAGVRPALQERGYATVSVRLDCAPDLAIKRRLRAKLPQFFSALTDDADLLAGLRAAYKPKDGQPAPKPLAIFLDQFEEFFIVFRDRPDVRRTFIELVAEIKYDCRLPIYFVFSVRDDYFVRLNEFREKIPSIFQNNTSIQLRPLDDEAALRAIVKPAKALGLTYQEGLPQQIIADLKKLTPGQDGVLPIALQIVCHRLWSSLPEGENRFTTALYGDEDQLGGAAKIIRNQLDTALRQVPTKHTGLMLRLFRVLMTPDLTKRLRSLSDLVEILRLRDTRKLEKLLEPLTRASVLRAEHNEGQMWYEFRHDYLVPQVAAWLNNVEQRLARRRLIYTIGIGAGGISALILAAVGIFQFNSLRLRMIMSDGSGGGELVIERSFNPFRLKITTGLYADDLDFEGGNEGAMNQFFSGGIPLPFGRVTDWRPFRNLLAGTWRGAFMSFLLNEPEGIPRMLAEDLAKVVEIASMHPEVQIRLAAIVKDTSANEFDRLHAAEAIGRLGKLDASCMEGLVGLLQTADPIVRRNVAEKLGQYGTAEAGVVEGLAALLKDADKNVRLNAAEALVQLRKADVAVVGWAALLKDTDKDIRLRAAQALVTLGKADAALVEDLLVLLKDSAKTVRLGTTEVLGDLGNSDVRVVTNLQAMLKDPDKDIRLSAAKTLVKLGKADAALVEDLLVLLKDNTRSIRLRTTEVLGDLGNSDVRVVTNLQALLKDPDKDVRKKVVAALDNLVNTNAYAAERLLDLLKDTNKVVRLNAAQDLVEMGKTDAPVAEALVGLLEDSDHRVLQDATRALGKLGKSDKPVVEGLLDLLQHTNENHRLNAAEALVNLGRMDVPLEGLLPLLKDTNQSNAVRLRAAAVLEKMGKSNAAVAESYRTLLKDSDPDIRLGAAQALVGLGHADALLVESLLSLLNDADKDVRLGAAEALVRLGKRDEPVVEVLQSFLRVGELSHTESHAATLIKLGRERRDWTEPRLLQMLQSDSSSQRSTAGLVLAGRENLSERTLEKIRALRYDKRPWVRMAAWDALLLIQRIHNERSPAPNQKQGPVQAK